MRVLPVIITLTALALFITPALAADVTIPINKDYTSSNGMVIHFDKVVISANYHGNTYSPDPANTTWYDLYFTYENTGSTAQNGQLEVSFYDDNGNKYPDGENISDITMSPLQPGTTSDLRFVEAAVIPKNANIVGFQVYDNFQTIRFSIPGGQTSTSTSAATASPSSGNAFCLSALLPLLVVGAAAFCIIKR